MLSTCEVLKTSIFANDMKRMVFATITHSSGSAKPEAYHLKDREEIVKTMVGEEIEAERLFCLGSAEPADPIGRQEVDI